MKKNPVVIAITVLLALIVISTVMIEFGKKPNINTKNTEEMSSVEENKLTLCDQNANSEIKIYTYEERPVVPNEVDEILFETDVVETIETTEEDVTYIDDDVVEDTYEEDSYVTTDYSEYPNANYIWNYLIGCGFNKYVTAGILGNIMAETGGHTLSIEPVWWVNGYYGMCMWSLYYCPEVDGMSLDEQCAYLVNTMEYQFNYYGYSYSYFCSLTDECEAALAFAQAYERCGSGSYGARQSNASYALSYFG